MCGIAGFLDRRVPDPALVCRRMTDALSHRGPDDSGCWVDLDAGVALGHRRLSIVDVSETGHQPMASPSGRYELVFNGEIYNHLEMRRDLESMQAGVPWRGRSDTETLLCAIETWGIETALKRCVGMFALAIWDRSRRSLTLARDRIGEKPLYYGRFHGALIFASELKAMRIHPAFDGEIDRNAVALLLRHCYIPEPESIYRNVGKLPAGTILEIAADGCCGEPRRYWDAAEAIQLARRQTFSGSEAEAVDALERVLEESIALQMIADVPVGAFLSGGIDSSLVVAMMQRRATGKVRTFTIGFEDKTYDESRYARAVAEHLGTEHTDLIVTSTQAMDVIPELPRLYDEPFADSSQIPTFLVSKLARTKVAVSLSGDAGDELFGGYQRYALATQAWSKLRGMPGALRQAVPHMIRLRPSEWWTRHLQFASRVLPARWRGSDVGAKLHRLADLVGCSEWEFYYGLVSHWTDSEVVIGGESGRSPVKEIMATPSDLSYLEQMMYWDLVTYLPGDILVKVDRAAMAVGLETRVPLLDHRVVEFAWSLPLHLKFRHGVGKWILRKLLDRYVPRQLVDRPKVGFGIPINAWLRGPLRDWAEAQISESRLRDEGILNPVAIRVRWQQHLAGTHDWAYSLWDVLMFQAWLEAQREFRVAQVA